MTDHRSAASPIYDLSDDEVKLVAYTIVSIKRGEERVMPMGSDQIVVADSLSREAFTSWMLGRYLQSKSYQELSDEDKVSEEDRKYLRVYFVVSYRWPREPLDFEERQLEILTQVREAI